jgi:hypothetical protein
MATRKAYRLVVTLEAGTQKFFTDMKAAGVEVKEFERKVGEGSRATVSEMKATSSAVKALEGNFFNNTKAADAFLEKVLGLGPVLQLAFPIVGGLAFAGMLGEVGNKAYEFFKKMQEAPEKTKAAFRGLTEGLGTTNDELRVANDRLENEIAKLEGRHQNTLKLALDEARVSADKLAEALNKDLTNLSKLLTENNVGWMQRVLGVGGTTDIKKLMGGESGVGGVAGSMAEILEEGNRKIAAAKTLSEAKDARTEAMTAANKELASALDQVNKKIAERESLAKGGVEIRGVQTVKSGATDQRVALEELLGVRTALLKAQDFIPLSLTNVDLTEKRDRLAAGKANAEQDRPFDKVMAEIGVQIEAVKAKLAAMGQGEEAQVLAKAYGEAEKSIALIDVALKAQNRSLDESQKAKIHAGKATADLAEADLLWQLKLQASKSSLDNRILSMNLLTAAIGKGYEATRAANVETRIMQELGEHFNDSRWMQSHQGDVAGMRANAGREFDAQHAEQSAAAVHTLNQQLELERELAAAQMHGAEAVRQATLAVKLRQMTAVGATKEQLAAEIELYNAQRANTGATDLAKIGERIAATQRLASALLQGADAERRAGLENKYAEIRRGGDIAIPGVIGMGQKELAERTADAADHQQKITGEALKSGMATQNQVELLGQEIAALEKIRKEQGDTMAIEISLRDLENQRLHALAQMSLQLGGMRDGVRAFFLEMQQDAKVAANVVYEALHSALDRTSANLAKLFTGQKTDWGKQFQDIGNKMLESSIKGAMTKGLGVLGEHFAPAKKFADTLGLNKPDGSLDKPFYVIPLVPGTAAAVGKGIPGAVSSGTAAALAGAFGGGSKGDGVFSLMGAGEKIASYTGGWGVSNAAKTEDDPGWTKLHYGGHPLFGAILAQAGTIIQQNAKAIGGGISSLFNKGGGLVPGAGPSADLDYGGAMAGGGEVDPGHVYDVGERGREKFIPYSRGRIVPHDALGGGVSIVNNNNIDARGADLGAHNRIIRGMEATHKSAVATAIQATHERSRRVPGGK